jgi:LPXTG-motif cell wall-anchored protein
LKLTRRHKAAGGGPAGAGLAGAVALAFAVPALAGDTTVIYINDGNVPTTAAGFENQGCDQVPDDTAAWLDGWVFVLPESVKAEGNFEYIEATFQDEDGNVLRYDTEGDGGIVSGSGNNKAYIITPAGLTLIDAEAEVKLKERKGNDKEPEFNLTHACPATEEPPGEETPSEDPSSPTEEPSSPTEEPSSPTEEPSSPSEEPSSPSEEPSSPSEEPSSPSEDPSSPSEDPSSPSEDPSSPSEDPSSPSEDPSSPSEDPSSPSEDPSSPSEDPSSPSEEPSSPAEESSSPAASSPPQSSSEAAPSSSAPGQVATTPAGSSLPTTGSSLTYVLLGAGVLLVAGVVLLVVQRRRGERTASDE